MSGLWLAKNKDLLSPDFRAVKRRQVHFWSWSLFHNSFNGSTCKSCSKNELIKFFDLGVQTWACGGKIELLKFLRSFFFKFNSLVIIYICWYLDSYGIFKFLWKVDGQVFLKSLFMYFSLFVPQAHVNFSDERLYVCCFWNFL